MISVEEIGNVVFDWCSMVINGATITIKDKNGDDKELDGSEILGIPAPALNIPLLPMNANLAGREDLYLAIQQVPSSYTEEGIDPIQFGIDTDYDFNDPDTAPTYSVAMDITPSVCLLNIVEVNGRGKHLSLLNKLKKHPMVMELFNSHSMGLKGVEGSIQFVPFTTTKSYHLECTATFKFSTMDGITYNQDFIASAEGSYDVRNAEGTAVITGNFSTENNTGE